MMVKSKGLLIALIVSLGINLGAIGTLVYNYIRNSNPKLRWKQWEKRHDETWQKLEDTLEITPEVAGEMRGIMKEGFEESKEYWDDYRIIRDSIIYEVSQPELDTVRLAELMVQDESLQRAVGMDMYKRLFEVKSMVPADKQALFLEYYKSSIYFTGQPWYIAEYKEHKYEKEEEE